MNGAQREKQARRERRQARYEVVRELADPGWGIQTIARHFRMGRTTVRRMLRAGTLSESASLRRRPSILDPYGGYLRERWPAGCHNAHALWVELCARGFTGSPTIVRRLEPVMN